MIHPGTIGLDNHLSFPPEPVNIFLTFYRDFYNLLIFRRDHDHEGQGHVDKKLLFIEKFYFFLTILSFKNKIKNNNLNPEERRTYEPEGNRFIE
jgi:hypothetical protein